MVLIRRLTLNKIFRYLALTAALLIPSIASAHVVLSPKQVATASFVTFNTSVPNERQDEITALRLEIPAGLEDVSPTVKPGWTITTKTSGDNVTEISWTGGAIPVGQRDDFSFSGHLPARATTLNWKAYQTYSDGTVVSWDQKPSASATDDDSATTGPYSTTIVSAATPTPAATSANGSTHDNTALSLAVLALVLALLGLLRRRL